LIIIPARADRAISAFLSQAQIWSNLESHWETFADFKVYLMLKTLSKNLRFEKLQQTAEIPNFLIQGLQQLMSGDSIKTPIWASPVRSQELRDVLALDLQDYPWWFGGG